MNLDTFTTILVAVAPAVSAMIVILTGMIKVTHLLKKLKNESNDEVAKANAKLLKAYTDMAVLRTKVASIEKLLLEQKEKKWKRKELL